MQATNHWYQYSCVLQRDILVLGSHQFGIFTGKLGPRGCDRRSVRNFLRLSACARFTFRSDFLYSSLLSSTVWTILVLELLFEVIIRPKGYGELIASEKAFAPSTARHINRFHLFFEFIALITFIPEFSCVADKYACKRYTPLNRVRASLDAVLGKNHVTAARGRFILGITTLRFFGLVRHWKQMWISNTFRSIKREGLENWNSPHEQSLSDTNRQPQNQSKKQDVSCDMSFVQFLCFPCSK